MKYLRVIKNNIKRIAFNSFMSVLVILLCSGCSQIGEKLQQKDKGIVVKENKVNEELEENQGLEYTSDKIKFTDKIKEDLLKQLPGLFNYNNEDEISNENKEKFIYNIFSKQTNDGDILNKKTIGGKEYNILEVSPVDVNNEFVNVFNKEIGIYTPQINTENPRVYYDNGLYYICINNEENKDIYKYIEYISEEDGIKVVYEKTALDGIKSIYNVYVKGADNNKGYAIYKVEIE